MESVKEPKKTARRDRVRLDLQTVTRLDQWISQVNDQLKGTKINRSDLVNFLVNEHSSSLNSGEIQKLRKLYFDETDFAEWALREFRKAKDKGENLSLAEMLKPVFPAIPRRKRADFSEKPREEASGKLPLRVLVHDRSGGYLESKGHPRPCGCSNDSAVCASLGQTASSPAG